MTARHAIPILVCILLLIHGGVLGLSDDEAYYWVLGQTPAWGYGYHPPMVGWITAISDWLMGWTSPSNPLRVRFASATLTASILWFLLRGLKDQGVAESGMGRAAAVILGLAGMFGASWMMVPDLPLFLGWALLWWSTWRAISLEVGRLSLSSCAGLFFGSAIVLLSKYSGVLSIGSALLALLIWGRSNVRRTGILCVLGGAILGLIPVLISAQQNGWGSLLYQIRDRHSDSQINWIRYARFWVIQFVIAGPAIFFWWLKSRSRWNDSRDSGNDHRRVLLYAAVWWVPVACVYFVQPLFSDFKPHWAIAVWLPIVLEMARWTGVSGWKKLTRWHVGHGLCLGILVVVGFHTTWIPGIAQKIIGRPIEPKLDVTNDLFGWRLLRERLDREPQFQGLRVIGSRYQTASQAAFVLNGSHSVSLVPRDQKQLHEWPHAPEVTSQGPEWPRLLAPVLFVADNRYDAPPEFPGARCETVDRMVDRRGDFEAKWILIYRCAPSVQ